MILTFAEDFTISLQLDSELLGTPESGQYWNRGVHPSFTIENLLNVLPNETITFSAYAAGTTYNKFSSTRKRSDIVSYDDKIYQSLVNSNIGNTPSSSPTQWLETNLNSLRIKSFIYTVEDNILSALSLQRKLIENQYIYNHYTDNKDLKTLPDNYAGWAFEPKGSDYVKIRINQIALQANTTDPVDMYIINQNQLIDTIVLNPNNGILEFEDVTLELFGKGVFYLVIDSQEVLTENAYNDALRYKGFVCYPISGIGASPQSANYSVITSGNGINFNVSAYLDSSVYIDNNKVDMASFYKAQFEYDFARAIVYKSNNRFNYSSHNQRDSFDLFVAEAMDLKSGTIAKNYIYQKKELIKAIDRTFDNFLNKKPGFKVKRKTL